MNARIPIALLAIASVFASGVTESKGTTIELSITGPDLEAPLHSRDKLLTSANVWFGGIFDPESGPLDTTADESSDYRIHFWVQFSQGDIQMKYFVWYRWDADSDRAIVCLPGETDPWYFVNVYSIFRGDEGSCLYANEEWGRAVKSILLDSE